MATTVNKADWKPESPDKFEDIAELLKSVDSIKLEETTKQGQGSKTAHEASSEAAPIPSIQKPAAYPHAKAAVAVQAELFGVGPSGELSKNALKNKKKRERQREKGFRRLNPGVS